MTERAPASPAPGNGVAAPGGVVRASAALLADALAGDDAEAEGVRAAELLADPERALAVLGGPDAWMAARHAVIQRYGLVGALLVLGYEERWRRVHRPTARRAREAARPADEAVGRCLEALVDTFAELDAAELDALLADLDRAAGAGAGDADTEARRWLHATYAVAARDRTDMAHRAYMAALDRVLRHARRRIAS